MSEGECDGTRRRLTFSPEGTEVQDILAHMNQDELSSIDDVDQDSMPLEEVMDLHQGTAPLEPAAKPAARKREWAGWAVVQTPPTPQQVSALRRRTAWKNTGPAPPQASRLQKALATKAFAQRSVDGGSKRVTVTPQVERMTALERQVLWQQTALSVLSVLGMGVGSSALIATKLRLFNYDIGKMAAATGQLTSLICAANLALGPVVAALSDRFGRRPFRLMSVLGQLLWLGPMASVTSVERYQELGLLAFGILGAGASSIQQAVLDDVFAGQPLGSARAQASIGATTSLVATGEPGRRVQASRSQHLSARRHGRLV